MKFWKNLGVFMTIFALAACGPELTRRYKSMVIESATDGVHHVRVSSFVREAPNPRSEPVVLQLSAEGQASLVRAIARADSSVTGLYQSLAKSFANQSSNDIIDRSQMTIRVVFSTQKTEIVDRPADRISSIQLRVENLPPDLRFQQWNRFETAYGEIDLGKIGLKKSTTASGKLSPTFAGSLVGTGEVGVTGSRELSEEVSLRQRFIAFTGTLEPDRATLIQEGVVGIDLSGNTSIDLTVEFIPTALELQDVVRFDSFTTNKGLKEPDDVSYGIVQIRMPKLSVVKKYDNGIQCRLGGNYILRQVRKGDKTIAEGDDDVGFIRGKLAVTTPNIMLISMDQLNQTRARFYIHKLGRPDQQLAIDHPGRPGLPLDFGTYEEAERFLDWLIKTKKATTVGGNQLQLNQRPLAQSDIVKLRIDRRP